MPVLSITKTYNDGDILTEQDLDNIRDDIEDFFNVTGIDSDNIQDGGIDTAKLADSSVTTAKINNLAVTTAKINDLAVTAGKLDTALQYNQIKASLLDFHLTGSFFVDDEWITFRCAHTVTITDCQLFIPNAGTAGTLTIDVETRTGAGAWTTIFSTRPSLAFGAGSLATSSNQVLSDTTITAGDYIRLNVDAIQTGCTEFQVRFIG